MPGCLTVHDMEQLRKPWCGSHSAGSRRSENIAPQYNKDLHLLRQRAVAVASRRLFTMYHIMVQGAEVPDVERTRPLREADAACVFQLHLQRAAAKNRHGGMEQRGPAVSVPAVLPLANFQQLHGRINEGIVCKVLLDERGAAGLQ